MISLMLFASTGRAGEVKRKVGYTGASIGMEALGGVTIFGDSRLGGLAGFVTGAAFRWLTVLNLLDFRAHYTFSTNGLSFNGESLDLNRHSLGLSMAVHPLFIVMFGNRLLHFIMSSLYLRLGISMEITALSGAALPASRTEIDLGWHWGAGMEFPLLNPNRGGTLWLGLGFQQSRASVNTGRNDLHALTQNMLLLTLGYRWNWR